MTKEEYSHKIKHYGVIPDLGGRGTMMQNPDELGAFCEFIEGKVRNYLEIGTADGALLKFMIEVIKVDGWGIDPFVIPTEAASHLVYKNKSGAIDAMDWARIRAPYDLIFIDGDHSYSAVKKDYQNYKGMAKKFIAFHDICGLRECEGVKQFWNEIKNKYQYREFVQKNDPAQKVGIGLLIL